MSFVQDLFVNNDANVLGALVIGQSTSPDASSEIESATTSLTYQQKVHLTTSSLTSVTYNLKLYYNF